MLFELLNPEAHGVKPATSAAFARFTLEHGVFAGQTFIAGLRVCENPCCPCEAVGFESHPARQHDACAAAPESAAYSFDLDVFTRQVNTAIQPTPDSETLARAVTAEMQEPDWQRLADLFLSTKRRVMKTMDVDGVRAQFPPGTRGKKGAMVGYVEIFPWADALGFPLDNARWMADDMYCVRPGCGCSVSALTFIQMPEKGSNLAHGSVSSPTLSLYYYYDSGRIELIDQKPGSPAPDKFVRALRAANSDLDRTLRNRHQQLKRLAERTPKTRRLASRLASFLRRNDAAETAPAPPPARAVARTAKVGRNDPCPCGSGKKYKKCCGGWQAASSHG
jgi:hypothetical protein